MKARKHWRSSLRSQVLGGTILGLVVFTAGSAGMYYLLDREAQEFSSVLDLYFPLQEKVGSIRLLLERQRSFVQVFATQPDPRKVDQFQSLGESIKGEFAAGIRIFDAMEPNASTPTDLQELRLGFDRVRDGCRACYRLQHDIIGHLLANEPAQAKRSMAELDGHAQRLQTLMANFDANLVQHRHAAVARTATARSSLHQLFLALAAAATLLGIAANIYFYRAMRPLQALVAAVRRIAGGDYEVCIAERGNDELAALAGEFNHMAAALSEQTRAIEESHEVIRGTFDGISDVLMIHDLSGRLLHANPAARTLLETKGPETSGCFRHVLRLEGFCPACPRDLDGQGASASLQIVRDDQTDRWYEVSCQPVRTSTGTVRFVVEFVRDVTEKLQIERQLRQSEKLTAIGELALGVAHEVRNPLSTIQMTLHAISKTEDLRPTETERLNLSLREVARLDRLVASLLDYGRVSPPRVVTSTVEDLVKRSLQIVQPESARRRVRMNIMEEEFSLPDLHVDPDQVCQILVNLLINAIQASTEGNAIEIGAGFNDRWGVSGAIYIRITDFGPGITKRDLAQVFAPFFTTRRHGTGLGLSIARKIAETHGGELTITSTLDRGTTVRLVLPTQPSARKIPAEAEEYVAI